MDHISTEFIKLLVNTLISKGISSEDIGVITSYNVNREQIKQKL